MFRAGLCSARYCIREAVRRTELRQQALHRTARTVPSCTDARHGIGRYGTAQYKVYLGSERHRPGPQRRQHAGTLGVIGPLECGA